MSDNKPKFLATEKLPPIPSKRYFTIGEVSELCLLKPHVLRYWEQEFTALKPSKRRGNRRYYQHKDLVLIRRIRELLYEEGFTISGARTKLQEEKHQAKQPTKPSTEHMSHLLEDTIKDIEETLQLLES